MGQPRSIAESMPATSLRPLCDMPAPGLPRRLQASWFAGALLVNALVLAGMMIHNRLVLTLTDPGFLAMAALLGGLTLVRYRTRAGRTVAEARWRDFSEHLAVLITICVLGAVASYETAADTSGFADAMLARSDRMLHFDWVALYRLVAGHPLLQHLGAAAYGSVYLSPTLLLAWMAWHGRREQAHRFLTTFWLASVLTLVLFPLLPARGALEFLWHGPIRYMPTSGLYQGAIIPGLRAHTVGAIQLGAVRGLVCAPSFHTACALIYMVSAWPFARLRLLLVPLNVAMLLAVPVEGVHYLTDMILGAAVALLAIMTVRLVAQRLDRSPESRGDRGMAAGSVAVSPGYA